MYLQEKSHFKSNSDSASDSALEDKLDDEGIPEALDHLNDFVSNLDITFAKRKATEHPSEVGASTDPCARKRPLVEERIRSWCRK